MHPGMISALAWTLLNKNMGPLNAYDEDLLSSCLMMLRNYGRPPSSKMHKLLTAGHFSPEPVTAEVLGGWIHHPVVQMQTGLLCEFICGIVQEDIRLGKFTFDLSSMIPVDLITFDPLTGLHPLEEKQVVTRADVITVLQTRHSDLCAKIITFVSKLVAIGLVSEVDTMEIVAASVIFGKRSEFYSFVDKSHVPLTKAEIDSKFDKLSGNALLEQLKETFSKWKEQRDIFGTSQMLSMLASAEDDCHQVLLTGITFTAPWNKDYTLKRSHVIDILHKNLKDCYKFLLPMILDVEWKSEPASCNTSVLPQLCEMFPDQADNITRVIRSRVFCARVQPNQRGHSMTVHPQSITYSPDVDMIAQMQGIAKATEERRAEARIVYHELRGEAESLFVMDNPFFMNLLAIYDHNDLNSSYFLKGKAQQAFDLLKSLRISYHKLLPCDMVYLLEDIKGSKHLYSLKAKAKKWEGLCDF